MQIQDQIAAVFKNLTLTEESRTALLGLGVALLLSGRQSNLATGIIVAGFDPRDMFPSVSITDIDGAICGRLKYKHKQHLLIDRDNTPGKVVSFAQTDVVDRLLSGADDRFIDETEGYIKSSLGKARTILDEALVSAGLSVDVASGIVGDVIDGVVANYKASFVKKAKEDFQNNFNSMVAMMPKQDIIEFAEAMVSISPIERNATSDQATVGGPVDIAFITKHEGFVWIKRKHYFEAELNPRYFWRKRLSATGAAP